MGSHAADQTQKEGQIAETVADNARPCASCTLCNKGKRQTCDCHASGVPESRLHEQMKDGPTDAMNNPCAPSDLVKEGLPTIREFRASVNTSALIRHWQHSAIDNSEIPV